VKRRLNATEDDGRIAAAAELRPVALNDLGYVYHYITTPGKRERRSRPDPRKLLKLWITIGKRTF